MSELLDKKGQFSTWPVFLTAIATILGAIMFLRFGWAVGNLGFIGALGIVVLGHLITIPTALAIAEIATNQKVEGGGEYFIISRSFGLTIGGTVGIALFISQAISVAFYIVAFAQAFDPVFAWVAQNYHIDIVDKRWISVPTLGILAVIVLTKGADLGIKALYVVIGTLAVSLIFFFSGTSEYLPPAGFSRLSQTIAEPVSFFTVFAICFPAFTGMTAGVGLSGDLHRPKRSIPLGTLSATVIGMFVYVLIIYKLAVSASPEQLAGDQLVMSQIAAWGPIIPIGLAAATISSALGSILVAPRTLQAIGSDNILPFERVSKWLSHGRGSKSEPFNSSIVVVCVAVIFLMIGDVDFVAQIISMFFMVTYGSICLISFLQHFASDPSYRPTFRSRWYVSLLGFVLCALIMLEMSPGYSLLAVVLMGLAYTVIKASTREKGGMAILFQGAIFQLSHRIHVFLQRAEKERRISWRPSVIRIGGDSFKRLGAFELLRWISSRYGFGTYVHLIRDYLNDETQKQAREDLERLISLTNAAKSTVYVDTLVSPSYTSAIAQAIQLPSISGKENNMMLFDYARGDDASLEEIIENIPLVRVADFDICLLGTSERGFGYHREIHVWLTSHDLANANLMILLAFIILGHKDWRSGFIKLFAVYPEDQLAEQRLSLLNLVSSGRLPIAANNVKVIARPAVADTKKIIADHSTDADLTIIGYRMEQIRAAKVDVFNGFDALGNVLFVNASKEKEIH